jgi:hypothetical protein
LPLRARMPLIAQIAGTVALVAAISMPRAALETKAPAPSPASIVPKSPGRPAHLNLDVRYAFQSVDLWIQVDGKPVFTKTLAGSAKRFGVFGKRAEKAFARSLDLSPGVRVVSVRLRSTADKFDHTRVERFDLDPASVAEMRIAANKSGLSVFAERPPAAERTPAPQIAQAPQGSALDELYKTLRAVLIAVAGFVGSAATGFVVQEFLRARKLTER